MAITVGDVLQVVSVLAWLDGNLMQNVFHAVIGGAGGPFDDEDIVDDAGHWLARMFLDLEPRMSDQVDGSEYRVYVYDPVDEDWDEVGTDAFVFNPTNAADELPRGASGLINVKTMDPDVSGKKFCGGFTEGDNTAGLVNATGLAALAGFADEWVTPFAGLFSAADWIPSVWSPTAGQPYAMTGTYLIPAIWAYQRRRKRGVGI